MEKEINLDKKIKVWDKISPYSTPKSKLEIKKELNLSDEKEYWVCMDCDKGNPHYFNTEKQAYNYAKTAKLKNFIVGKECHN